MCAYKKVNTRKEKHMLSINGLNSPDGRGQNVQTAKTTKQEKLNSLFGGQKNVKKTDRKQDLIELLTGRNTKTVTTVNADGSKTKKTYNKDGKLLKEAVYKDVNSDGKEDIYSVTNYYEAYDDPVDGHREPAKSQTFIDEDGDGFDDYSITKTFDENGKVKSETKTYFEDINDVKKRNHMPWEIYNRQMSAQESGALMC